MQSYPIDGVFKRASDLGYGINVPIYLHKDYYLYFLNGLRPYKRTRKVFSSIGLNDQTQKLTSDNPKFDIFYKIIKIIDTYLHPGRFPFSIWASYQEVMKEYNSNLSLFKDKHIVFSSDPWDIASMSMRGTPSCMSWSKDNSSHLAGSILDPYCAIIYLTDSLNADQKNSFSFGPRMLIRSVVRLIKDGNKSWLLMEPPYFHHNLPSPVRKLFPLMKEFLFDKTGIEVIDSNQITKNMSIPKFPELALLESKYISYRDSGIRYDS